MIRFVQFDIFSKLAGLFLSYFVCKPYKHTFSLQNTSLFYHSETQTYYYYDETDGQYKVYQSMKPRPYWGPIDGPSSSIRTIIHTLQLNGRDELIDEQLLIYSDIGRLR